MKDLNKEIGNINRELTTALAKLSINMFKRKERKIELAYAVDKTTLQTLQDILSKVKEIELTYRIHFEEDTK